MPHPCPSLDFYLLYSCRLTCPPPCTCPALYPPQAYINVMLNHAMQYIQHRDITHRDI